MNKEKVTEVVNEIIIDRMKREFKVEANIGQPKVAYRETITKKIEIDYTHKKQSGGSGQFAKVKIVFEPMPADITENFLFESKVVGGRVPKEVQRFMMSIISKNIEQYINYLEAITHTTANVITKINGANIINNKIEKFRDFITFVRLMIPNFKQFKPSKNAMHLLGPGFIFSSPRLFYPPSWRYHELF